MADIGGAFHASPIFRDDPLETAKEIERCGAETLGWLASLASQTEPAAIEIHLVREIHRRWFATTFPDDAGRERTSMVLNRKGTALPVEALIPAVRDACDTWDWRFRELFPKLSPEEQAEFAIADANRLAVQIYDAHPFLDGNTRTTFHLRNYALMLTGLPPVLTLHDDQAHKDAWMKASVSEHGDLDDIVLEALFTEDDF